MTIAKSKGTEKSIRITFGIWLTKYYAFQLWSVITWYTRNVGNFSAIDRSWTFYVELFIFLFVLLHMAMYFANGNWRENKVAQVYLQIVYVKFSKAKLPPSLFDHRSDPNSFYAATLVLITMLREKDWLVPIFSHINKLQNHHQKSNALVRRYSSVTPEI